VLYAVIAGLIVWIIISILSHVHIIISWHLSVTTVGSEDRAGRASFRQRTAPCGSLSVTGRCGWNATGIA